MITQDMDVDIDEEIIDIIYQAHMWELSNVVEKCCQFFIPKTFHNYNDIFNSIGILDLQNNLDEQAFFLLKL